MNSRLNKSLRRMPAEWEPHRATWISWPHEASDWLGEIGPVFDTYAEIVRALQDSEQVEILIDNEESRLSAEKHITSQSNVGFHLLPTDRSWLRDSAPTGVILNDETLEWIHWEFNAWAKYSNFQLDRQVPEYISKTTKIQLQQAQRPDNAGRLVLEGGAFDTDGAGTLLVTEECLLSDVQQRNPGLLREDYEKAFLEYLGIKKTIWLPGGIIGDDTHGHIDDLARFVAPHTLVLAYESRTSHPNYAPCQAALEILQSASDASGNPLQVHLLPMPEDVLADNEVLPASYANFYIANTTVIVPVFNDPNDEKALALLASLFPSRRIVGINCRHLVIGQGTLHCLSQQEPYLSC